MKRYTLLIFLFSLVMITDAQVNYLLNLGHHPFGKRQSEYHHVFHRDSSYYIEGYVAHGWYGTYPEQFKLFMKLDREGKVVKKVGIDSEVIYMGGDSYNTVIEIRNGFISASMVSDSIYNHGVLMKLDFNLDTLWVKRYDRALFTSDAHHVYISDVKETPDLGFVLCGHISKDQGNHDRYPFLMRVNKIGDVLWIKRFIDEAYIGSQFRRVEITDDNGLLILSNFNVGTMLKTDQQGNLQWVSKIPNDSLYTREGDLLHLGGDEYICAIPYYYEIVPSTPHYSHIYTGVALSSVNGRTGEVNWHKNHIPFNTFHYMPGFKLIPLSKGFGLMANLQNYPLSDPNYPYKYQSHGVLMVYDREGDSLSSHVLYKNDGSECWLRDALIEPDGSVTGVGIANGLDVPARAWIFKTDTGLMSDYITEPVLPEFDLTFRVYPVPAEYELSFEFNRLLVDDFSVELYSIDGKMVLNKRFSENSSLYKLSLANLSSGFYVYRVFNPELGEKVGKMIVK